MPFHPGNAYKQLLSVLSLVLALVVQGVASQCSLQTPLQSSLQAHSAAFEDGDISAEVAERPPRIGADSEGCRTSTEEILRVCRYWAIHRGERYGHVDNNTK
ncbi:hypothetical protein BJ546DRAFT_39016 [Cryomyces antarcticus]